MIYNIDASGRFYFLKTGQEISPPSEIQVEDIYPPQHLTQHVVSYNMPKGDVVKVKVTYSCHCYTHGYDEVKYPEESLDNSIVINDSRMRIFDKERYDASLNIPRIISNLQRYKVYITKPKLRLDRNYTTFDSCVKSPNGDHYRLFFTLKRNKGRFDGVRFNLEMYVESAYFSGNQINGMEYNFTSLLNNTLLGKEVTYKP